MSITVNSYKNFKHIKAFKYPDEREIDKENESEDAKDSILIIVPVKCDCCAESYDLVYDEIHGDIICKKCGCVIRGNMLL